MKNVFTLYLHYTLQRLKQVGRWINLEIKLKKLEYLSISKLRRSQ